MPSSGIAFPSASRAESLRASQKDRIYCEELTAQTQATLSALIGERANAWQAEVQALAAAAYFGLTVGVGHPTPGEEHCDLARVCRNGGLPAGAARRWLCVVVGALLPFAIHRASVRLIAAARRRDEGDYPLLHALATRLDDIHAACDRLRLAIFYLGGRYLHPSLLASGLVQVRIA